MNEIVKDDKYTTAWNLNVRICQSAQMAQQNLYEVCVGLKEMRDTKLYKELDCQNFEEYCEKRVGFGRMQAHRLIAIAEKLPQDFVTSMLQIGTTKLALLAKLDESQREEIQQNVDVEEVSVRELKAEINKLHEKEAGYKERQDKLLQKNKELVSDVQRVENERDRLESDLDEAKDTVQSLEKQIEELENLPRDTYEDTTKIEELKKQLAEAEKRYHAELAKAQAIPAEDVKGVFKAYMIAAVDALRNLTQFTENHVNAPEKSIFIEKLENVNILINQTISKLKGV